jgi:hypothetical protein
MFQMAFETKPALTPSTEFVKVKVERPFSWRANGTFSPSRSGAHEGGARLNDTEDALELLIV